MLRTNMTKFALWLISLTLVAQTPVAQNPDVAAKAQATARLRALLDAAPQGILRRTELPVIAPSQAWELGMISWVDVDRKGNIYLLQRGEKADPVVVIDRQGHVLRSWGRGLYKIPHSIRIDPAGNVWTTDAESSTILKFTPDGKKLLQIEVGEQPPVRRSHFVGTTDIAFGPHGRLFITDGYGNARVLEYTPDGKRVRQWGTAGSGPGQFRLPHGIAIDRDNIIYVADRENGRVQKFDLDGKFIGEWALGRTYAVRASGGTIWASMQPIDLPVPSPGWIVKLDRKTGKVLGSVESDGLHGLTVTSREEILTGVTSQNKVLWFR
jgi:outer membrane protein assembly factor BamB